MLLLQSRPESPGRLAAQRNFDWVLSGCDFAQQTDCIIVSLHRGVAFRVVVSPFCQQPNAPRFVHNVEQMRGQAPDADAVIARLRLESARATARGSAMNTPPPSKPIMIPLEVLGTGATSTVSRVWDVSTGCEYACKQPSVPSAYNEDQWDHEVAINKALNHNHVRCLDWAFAPAPLDRLFP